MDDTFFWGFFLGAVLAFIAGWFLRGRHERELAEADGRPQPPRTTPATVIITKEGASTGKALVYMLALVLLGVLAFRPLMRILNPPEYVLGICIKNCDYER